MTTTPPASDAAGPVEAVLAEAVHRAFHEAWTHPDPLDLYVNSPIWAFIASALAPLFAAHGAAERRAGAVEALEQVERLAEDIQWSSPDEVLVHRIVRDLRAAALGDRADEASGGQVDTMTDPYGKDFR